MAISKTSITVLASTSVPAGTVKTSPVAGAAIDCRAYYGGELTYTINNGSTPPALPCSLTFQSSYNGTSWYDYYTVAGDATASSLYTGSILLDRGVMYLRVIAYGNTSLPVQVEAYLQAVTGL